MKEKFVGIPSRVEKQSQVLKKYGLNSATR